MIGTGQTIQLTAWPEDFIISPDPQTGGGAVPQPQARGSVLVIAALPDPTGSDSGAETITLINISPSTVNLTGWALSDAAGAGQALSGELQPGATERIALTGAVSLANQGDTIQLSDPTGQVIDQVAYQRNQVRAGRTIAFGR